MLIHSHGIKKKKKNRIPKTMVIAVEPRFKYWQGRSEHIMILHHHSLVIQPYHQHDPGNSHLIPSSREPSLQSVDYSHLYCQKYYNPQPPIMAAILLGNPQQSRKTSNITTRPQHPGDDSTKRQQNIKTNKKNEKKAALTCCPPSD